MALSIWMEYNRIEFTKQMRYIQIRHENTFFGTSWNLTEVGFNENTNFSVWIFLRIKINILIKKKLIEEALDQNSVKLLWL